MKGSDFIFESVHLMYYRCHKVSFIGSGLYIDYPDWIKKKIATINPKNKDDIFLRYAVTVRLNYGDIESHPERVSNI